MTTLVCSRHLVNGDAVFKFLIFRCVHSGYWRRWWHPTPVLLPGKSHGQRSLVGCSPWGLKKSDTTEWLPFHFSLPCIGEGNGTPLQCSCLENPRDGGAWRAAVYGVAQSWTRLKRLGSSVGFCAGSLVKSTPAMQEMQVWSLGQEDPLERERQPTPVFLPGKFCGQRSLAGCSPWDTTWWLHDGDDNMHVQLFQYQSLKKFST